VIEHCDWHGFPSDSPEQTRLSDSEGDGADMRGERRRREERNEDEREYKEKENEEKEGDKGNEQ
jgi:hypothetical protein